MTISLTFTIELCSDYHVGAGQGAGLEVDSALLRDHDNTPALRGSILAGLFRDGFHDLCQIINDNDNLALHRNQAAAEMRLFGKEGKRKRWAFSSARPVKNHALENKNSTWGAQPVTRVRVNPRTRRVAPQQLFTEEEGDRRLRFEFTISCAAQTTENQADAALLIASARMVRHLGKARRRGRGECVICLTNATGFVAKQEQESWTERGLAEFKALWLQPQSDEISTIKPILTPITLTHTHQYKRFRIVARTIEPLLVAYRSQTANAFETLPMVPGTAVIGALATRAAAELQLYNSYQPPTEFIELFLRGAIRTTGLLPASESKIGGIDYLIAAIPTPQTLWQCESFPAYTFEAYDPDDDNSHPINNTLATTAEHQCETCGGKLKQVNGHILLQDNRQLHKLYQRGEMHIRLSRDTGRAKEGNLYEYITLEAGQWFVGELECDTGAWERLARLTDLVIGKKLSLRLGKATQRGYGLINLFLEEVTETAVSPFITTSLKQRLPQVVKNSSTFSLLCLTDTIVADSWHRFYRSFDEAWLAKALHISTADICIKAKAASSRIVDSFHTYRQMPRWRDEAIEAGSVALIEVNNIGNIKVFHDNLARLEQNGIGLRTHEGFGRCAINHPLLDKQPKFDSLITYQTVQDIMLASAPPHPLQTEAKRIQEWREKLTSDNSKEWQNIDATFDAVARLVFLQRHKPYAELESWFKQLEKPGNLWGNKSFVARDSDPKLDKVGLALVQHWLQKADDEMKTEESYALALEVLAERVADLAAEDREKKKKVKS